MDSAKKSALKAQAHHLKPVVILGSKGLTDAVIEETNQALLAHELIKVKINGQEKEEKLATVQSLCHALQAEMIQLIGNTLIIYRQNEQ